MAHFRMNKKQMSGEEIKLHYITPAIIEKGKWDRKQLRMEVYFTDGKIILAGKTV